MPVATASPLALLDAHFAAEARLILLHILPSLLFVILVPLQFVARIRDGYPAFHRWNGRVILGLSMVLGISALVLSAHPIGGAIERAATVSFGCLYLICLAQAWWHIRKKQVDQHREWAIRMVAIALGVATTRPIIGVFFATSRLTGLTPQQFFGPAMWLGFVSTVLLGEAWIRSTRSALLSQHVHP